MLKALPLTDMDARLFSRDWVRAIEVTMNTTDLSACLFFSFAALLALGVHAQGPGGRPGAVTLFNNVRVLDRTGAAYGAYECAGAGKCD